MCEPPAFTSAGGHVNPGGRQHGLQNPRGPHAGDLPNIRIEADGSGRLESLNDRITLGAGPTSLFDGDGSALVIHAAADDLQTDPTGNSGGRLACGVIVKP
jgi:Cu-Zn family superoxide dismutase